MIWGPDGKRLSKRHGATSVEEYREEGYLPDAMVNYLALLGWSLDGDTTLFDRDTLCSNFSLEHVSSSPAVFDNEKLSWMNGTYLRDMDESAFCDLLCQQLVATGLTTAEDVAARPQWYQAIRPLIFERVKHTTEMAPMVAYLFGDSITLDDKSVQKVLAKEGAKDALLAARETLSDTELAWDAETLETAMRGTVERLGVKAKLVFQPLRVAICGNMVSPPLFESIELLGHERTLARIEAALPEAL